MGDKSQGQSELSELLTCMSNNLSVYRKEQEEIREALSRLGSLNELPTACKNEKPIPADNTELNRFQCLLGEMETLKNEIVVLRENLCRMV